MDSSQLHLRLVVKTGEIIFRFIQIAPLTDQCWKLQDVQELKRFIKHLKYLQGKMSLASLWIDFLRAINIKPGGKFYEMEHCLFRWWMLDQIWYDRGYLCTADDVGLQEMVLTCEAAYDAILKLQGKRKMKAPKPMRFRSSDFA